MSPCLHATGKLGTVRRQKLTASKRQTEKTQQTVNRKSGRIAATGRSMDTKN